MNENEILPFATIRVDPEYIMLSEINTCDLALRKGDQILCGD